MNLKKLFKDDRAVSPVIGVILMVAITVILAAVIGAFVLGLTDNVQSTPQAQLSFEKTENDITVNTGATPTDFDNFTINHQGGDTLNAENIDVVSLGENIRPSQGAGSNNTSQPWSTLGSSGDISAGSTADFVVEGGNSEGTTFQVVYNNPDSDKTAILAEYTA